MSSRSPPSRGSNSPPTRSTLFSKQLADILRVRRHAAKRSTRPACRPRLIPSSAPAGVARRRAAPVARSRRRCSSGAGRVGARRAVQSPEGALTDARRHLNRPRHPRRHPVRADDGRGRVRTARSTAIARADGRAARVSPRARRARPRPGAGARRRGAPAGPLHGVPVALKDNMTVRRRQSTTAGSKILEHYRPPYDATVVRRLEDGRRGHRRQDHLRRVLDGILDRELGVRPVKKSLGSERGRRADRAADRPWPSPPG